mgnify:CR=1 FL=1
MSKKILITGGLGYIGSHIAKLLGEKAVILDNKSNSSLDYKKKLPKAKVYVKNVNYYSLNKVFLENKITGVIHLASLKAANESVNNPLAYYEQNVFSTIQLLQTMRNFKINNIIFSSSATVYGNSNDCPLKEDMILNSVNPYGSTKICIERLVDDYCKSDSKVKAISLRYFNPLGADKKAGLLDQPKGVPQNILPILINSIKNKQAFKIFGNDYETKDGTCIRDYIHVKDLASAHLLALQSLSKIKGHVPINIGLGKGLSVLELVKLFEKANNISIKYKISKRREGDVAISYADNTKAKKILGWKPKFNHLDMLRDAWEASLNL